MSHVYRVSFKIFLTAGALLFSPAFAFAAAQSSVFSGTVSSVSPCANLAGSSLVSFNSNVAPVVYENGVSQSVHGSIVPANGQYLFGLSSAGDTCNALFASSNQVISYYASTTPSAVASVSSQSGTGSAQSSGSSGGGFLDNSLLGALGSSLANMFGGTVSSAIGSAVSGALGSATGAAGTGVGVFGGFITPMGVCDNGIPYWVTGIPYTGPMIWIPGLSSVPPYLYALGAPPLPGFIIGHYVTSTCLVPPAEPIPMPMMFGYGTGLAGMPNGGAPGVSSAANASCPQTQYNLSTASGKTQAEAADRSALSSEGISINASACAVGQNGVAGHCTDLSGLQCNSMNDLSKLASQCGGFQITGGSEAGHSSQHSSGNAVDISHNSSLDSCIVNSFSRIQCPQSVIGSFSPSNDCWVDSSTKSIYWAEPTVNGESAHWHVCLNGYCQI